MPIKKTLLVSVFILGILLSTSTRTFAQTVTNLPIGTNPMDISFGKDGKPIFYQNSQLPAGSISNTVNCFDYYKFGSVSADITARSTNGAAGSDMAFSGVVKNNNPYPVVDGTLYVKIFKVTGNGEKNVNGPDVVDQFVALKDISIPANGEVPASFVWKIPLYTEAGNYRIATFFETAQAFNLLGLSFTDDVVGNTFDFKVQSENNGAIVSFNKTNVTINDKPYYFAAFPPKIDKNKGANVSAEVKNTTSQKQFVNVVWTIYKWDSLKKENVIRTETKTVEVKANSSIRTTLLVPDTEFPVYLVEAKLGYRDTSSILNIRFVRPGVDLIRINFPSITSYPLVSGKATSVFSCLHNSGNSSYVNNGRLVLSLIDKNGSEIHHYEYSGKVTGDMMGVKSDFIPKSSYNVFSLKTDLYQDGKLVDSATHTYDCSKLGLPCSVATVESTFDYRNMVIPGLIGLLAIIIIILLVAMNHKARNKALFGLILLLTFSAVFSLKMGKVEAASGNAIWDGLPNTTLYSYNERTYPVFGTMIGWFKALTNIQAHVSYNAEVRRVDGTPLNNHDSIPVNTQIILAFKKHVFTDINWNATGFALDTPFGQWGQSNVPPPLITPNADNPDGVTCEVKDKLDQPAILNNSGNVQADIFSPLIIDPPTKTIVGSGVGLTGLENLSCGSFVTDANGDYSAMCTVTSTGKISPVFRFAKTTGQFYFRYYDPRDIWYHKDSKGNWFETLDGEYTKHVFAPGCYGNNRPLAYDANQALNQNGYTVPIDPSNTYVLPVDQKDISFVFNDSIVSTNHAPLVTISGPTTGVTSNPQTFNITGSDQDNDQLYYYADWENNNTWTQIGGPGSVAPGTIQATHTWQTEGIKDFKVKVIDISGAPSSPATWSITLTSPVQVFDFTLMNDGDKNITAGQSVIEQISSNPTPSSNTTKPVTLSVSVIGPGTFNTVAGLKNHSPLFFPASFQPPASSQLILDSTKSTTQVGTYTVTVTGVSPSPNPIIRSTTFNVTVSPSTFNPRVTAVGDSDCKYPDLAYNYLSWDAQTSATGYNIYRTVSGGAYIKINSSPVTVLYYKDTPAVTGASYKYVIAAIVGGVDISNRSEEVGVVGAKQCTLVPPVMQASCTIPTTITVPSTTVSPTVTVTGQITNGGGGPYYYVPSTLQLTEGANSLAVTAVDSITGQTAPMTCNTNLVKTYQTDLTFKVIDPVTNQLKSSIYVSPGTPITLIWQPVNATSCKATGAWSGVKDHTSADHTETQTIPSIKTFYLQCTNDTSPPVLRQVTIYITSPVTPTPSNDPNILGLNVQTKAGNVCGTLLSSATLTWRPYPTATSYSIWRKLSVGGTYAQVGQNLIYGTVSYVDQSPLVEGTKYKYQVRAILPNGTTFNSDEYQVTWPILSPCASGFTATCTIPPTLVNTNSVTVTGNVSGNNGAVTFTPATLTNLPAGINPVIVTVTDSSTPTPQTTQMQCSTHVIYSPPPTGCLVNCGGGVITDPSPEIKLFIGKATDVAAYVIDTPLGKENQNFKVKKGGLFSLKWVSTSALSGYDCRPFTTRLNSGDVGIMGEWNSNQTINGNDSIPTLNADVDTYTYYLQCTKTGFPNKSSNSVELQLIKSASIEEQ